MYLIYNNNNNTVDSVENTKKIEKLTEKQGNRNLYAILTL